MSRWIILSALLFATIGSLGCETVTLIQDDFDRGVARGFHELDKTTRYVDDTTHRWRHGY